MDERGGLLRQEPIAVFVGTFVRLAILDVWYESGMARRVLPMTMKCVAILALALAMGSSLCAPAFAGGRHHDRRVQSERYVPAEGDLIDVLFGGPRYYDQQLFTTAAGACSYNRVGPDANASNKINDHHCGK
jgi:hypothetical protein